MGKEEKFDAIDRRKLPLFYRLVLKIPVPSLSPSSKIAGGIFWAIIAPIFIVLNGFLNFIMLISFPFPVNLVLVLIVPAILFLIFAKITLERLIVWWNIAVVKGYTQREIKEILDEYLVHVKKKSNEE